MEFGETLRHPLLQVVLGVGEATIREACATVPGSGGGLEIWAELGAFPDGREAVRVTVCGAEARGRFMMLLRNYFNREALWRVAREAWRRREIGGEGRGGERTLGEGWGIIGMN